VARARVADRDTHCNVHVMLLVHVGLLVATGCICAALSWGDGETLQCIMCDERE